MNPMVQKDDLPHDSAIPERRAFFNYFHDRLMVQGLSVAAAAGAASSASAADAPITDTDAARFLAQAGLGVTDESLAKVKTQGFNGWLDAQILTPPTGSRYDYLFSYKYNTSSDDFGVRFAGINDVAWLKLMSSPDELRQRVTLALSEIFVVPAGVLEGNWPAFMIGSYLDLLEQNAFGNFRTLLKGITLHPAMAYSLSMKGNRKADYNTGRRPDENFAREIMQLFTIGLYELNMDGSLKLDANSKPIETYSIQTVTEVAKVFTGWDITIPSNIPSNGIDRSRIDYAKNPLTHSQTNFSTEKKDFLGISIPASDTGPAALEKTLDVLFNHPNVPPFISKQLIQRLVTSNPSPDYIRRVANIFVNNGLGKRGDLGTVIKAILLDPEARRNGNLNPPHWGKIREPMLRLVQWARTFGVTCPSGQWKIGDTSLMNALGQSPMRSSSVFNFFRPGYIPPNSAVGDLGYVAPELQITNESTVTGYINYIAAMISAAGSQNSANTWPATTTGLMASYSKEMALVSNSAALIARINLLMCANALSQNTIYTITSAINSMPVAKLQDKKNKIYAAILLVMSSPEYLVQR